MNDKEETSIMRKTFTGEEVIKLLTSERERAVKIAYEVKEKHDIHYVEKKRAGNKLAFIEEEIADVCRIIGNSISGVTALNISEDIETRIINKLHEYCRSQAHQPELKRGEREKDFTQAIAGAIKEGKTEFEFEGETHLLCKLNLAPSN